MCKSVFSNHTNCITGIVAVEKDDLKRYDTTFLVRVTIYVTPCRVTYLEFRKLFKITSLDTDLHKLMAFEVYVQYVQYILP